jgi:hypothetical protein
LGNDDHYVKLVKTGEVEIRPNNGLTTYDSPSATWIFGTGANLSIPSSRNGNGSFVNSQTAINLSSGPYYLADIAPFATGGGMNTLAFHQDTYPGILNVAVGDTIHNVIGDYLVSTVDSVSQPNTTTITTTYNSGPQVTVNLFSFAKPNATGGTWAFGSDGNLVLPGGAGFVKGDSGQLKTNDGTTLALDFRDSSGRGFYTNSDGYTLRSNGSNNWVFGTNGNLTLPANGNISYAPGNAASWTSPAPTTIEEAIDRLAVVVNALNGGTGA